MIDTIICVVIFSGILGLVGIILFAIGISTLIIRNKKKRNCTLKIYGKILNIIRKEYHDVRHHKTTYSWHPVFEYTIGELKFTKVSTYGNLLPTYEKIGQNVELYCNPENFNEYYVEELHPKTLGRTFAISGIIIITIAVFSAIIITIIN